MPRSLSWLIVLSCSLGATWPATEPAISADWPAFRGFDRLGVSSETGLLRTWPDGGPPTVWTASVGQGFSGMAVVGDRLFTQYSIGDDEFLGAFSVADGQPIWRYRIGGTFRGQFGEGPRSTPTVDGEVVFGLGALGRLAAVRAATGEAIWEVDLHSEKYGFFGPQVTPAGFAVGVLQQPLFGYAVSPLVEGDLVVVETGTGNGRSLVAFDRATGAERWSALDEPGITYSSPMAVTVGGRRQILAYRPHELVSLDPSGTVLWRHPWAMAIAQPIPVPPDGLFLSTTRVTGSDSEGGAVLLEFRDQPGGAAVEPAWESREMRNYWSSSVLYDGHIYGFDNATLRCIAAASGEGRWAKRGLGKGSLIVADGLLILWSDQGVLTLAEADPESYSQIGQAQVFEKGRTWTPPALAGGKLFLRGGDEIVCLNLQNPS